ncbi:toxic anion resistance protein, partial [Paenibacillus amylolyticus]
MAKDRSDDSMGAQNDQTPLKHADTLPEEKREAALQLAEKLDPENMQSIVLFGSQAQANLLEFSHT